MKKKTIVILVILALAIIVLSGYNIYLVGCKDFFTVTIGQVMTVSVAIYFAFYLTQKNADIRIRKEIYAKRLQDIQTIADDKDTFIILDNADTRKLTMKKRMLSNCVEFLKKYSEDMGVKNHIDIIEKRADEYSDLIGNHIDDIGYLTKSELELRRPMEIISKEAVEAMMELYK